MKLLITFLLLAASAFCQNAVYNNFSPTVKGITIGTYHCYFWMHASAPAPWDNEIACYSGSSLPMIMVGIAGVTLGDPLSPQVFQSADALTTFTFSFTPNTSNSAQTDYALTGKGPSDGSPIVVTGTI
jgi:hypothetical protein